MLRKIITLISIGLIAGVSAEKSDKMEQIQKSIEKITAKAGISIDGEVKSQYLSSKINGNGANDMQRKSESNEFTSVDFDIKARPNEMIGGRVIFRMHQNWQNFFSDVANPIFTRWISIDGNIKDMFYFHAGDFKEQYSPLTLYSSDIEILNEPYIFARQRDIAMSDVFVGNNDRALQGVNLKFEAEIAPIFNEFRLSLIGSRLRNVDVATTNNLKVTQEIQAAKMAKYLIGGNLDLTFLKGIDLGGTYLFLFDQKSSYRKGTSELNKDSADVLAQRTSVLSLRPGVDITKIIGVDPISFKLATEFAFSSDDSTRFGDNFHHDTARNYISEKINGSAINIGGQLGITPSDMWGIKISGSFLMNDKNYRNDLAQSPSFIGDRVMNKENRVFNDTLYNTFDALYHYVFKFTPSEGTNNWAKAPYMKNSYTRTVYTQDEMARLLAAGYKDGHYLDPALQLVMPFGLATANRVGINANVNASLLKEGIVAKVIYANLKEKEEYIGDILWRNEKSLKIDSNIVYPKAEFSQFGAGLKLDLSKMIPVFKYPFELSGSYTLSSLKVPEVDSVSENSITSGFINLGLYYKFYKRAALLGGYQIINNTYSELKVGEQKIIDEAKVNMVNWAFGLEWKVSDGASVVTTYGRMSRDNPDIVISEEGKDDKIIDTDTHQSIVDVSLRILF